MGIYMQIVAMAKAEYKRQINVLPLTLGPYGSNFQDVMKALEPMYTLDRGIVLTINKKQVIICTPIFALAADMVQH